MNMRIMKECKVTKNTFGKYVYCTGADHIFSRLLFQDDKTCSLAWMVSHMWRRPVEYEMISTGIFVTSAFNM
jgi:hypothetical protein